MAMKKKFHINDFGEVKPCKANVKDCRFEQHFENQDDAYAHIAEEFNDRKFSNTRETFVNKFIEEYRGIIRISHLVNSENIYEKAKLFQIAQNFEKYPYKNHVDLLTDEERERIISKGRSLNSEDEASLELAVSSKSGWNAMVMPNLEKQVYQEKTLFNFLKKSLPNYTVDNLPGGGKDAYYLVNGKIITGAASRPKPSIKSLDFYIETPSGDSVFVVAKYTMGEGGGQDNQYKDAMLALEEQTKDSEAKLVLILDGTYYQKKGSKESRNKIQVLQEDIIDRKGLSNAFVGTYEEALNWLKKQ